MMDEATRSSNAPRFREFEESWDAHSHRPGRFLSAVDAHVSGRLLHVACILHNLQVQLSILDSGNHKRPSENIRPQGK